MRSISLPAQTMFSELSARCLDAEFDEAFHEAGRFKRVTIKEREYWYYARDRDGERKTLYVGPVDDAELSDRVARFGRQRADYQERRELVRALLQLGLSRPDPMSGAVADALARAGMFRLRGVLVGTAAYQCYAGMLGIRLPGAGLMTQDLDAAQFHAVSVEVGDSMPPMLETLQAVNATFREMSSFADDGRVWRYSASNPKFDVEFLTPLRGGVEHGRKPLRMPALGGASAQALRFLDFLLRDPVRSVLLHGGGVSVTVPAPERYATHKLIVASRRTVNPDKARKDIAQASALIEVLRSARPVELREAVTELIGRGPAWRKAFEAGKARLPPELASAL